MTSWLLVFSLLLGALSNHKESHKEPRQPIIVRDLYFAPHTEFPTVG